MRNVRGKRDRRDKEESTTWARLISAPIERTEADDLEHGVYRILLLNMIYNATCQTIFTCSNQKEPQRMNKRVKTIIYIY
jgi:hypothetical protein